MCWCRPEIRTPFCGRAECYPKNIKKDIADSDNKSIATRLAYLRFKSGKSLQEVADIIGCSKAHVYEIETGKQDNPSIKYLLASAKHYGVTLMFLVGEQPAQPETTEE